MKDSGYLFVPSHSKMQSWHRAKGVTSPIIGATQAQYMDEAVGALEVQLTAKGINIRHKTVLKLYF